jgi:hypothetical protein
MADPRTKATEDRSDKGTAPGNDGKGNKVQQPAPATKVGDSAKTSGNPESLPDEGTVNQPDRR